jgi:hypothetical protein
LGFEKSHFSAIAGANLVGELCVKISLKFQHMKNIVFASLLLSLAACQSPQSPEGGDAAVANETLLQSNTGKLLNQGNLVAIHIITVEPKPNVTMDQVLDFYITKWAPAEAQYFGLKNTYFGKCLRGTGCTENKILMLTIFNTTADRDKYFKMDEGGNDLNELGEKAWAQFSPTYDSLMQLATIKEEWEDWMIK